MVRSPTLLVLEEKPEIKRLILPPAFGTVDHHLHGKRRAALSPLFSSRAFAKVDGIMQEQVKMLSDAFRGRFTSTEVVELRSVSVAFTMDTICQYVIGEPMGLQRDGKRAMKWWRTLEEVSKTVPMAKQFPWMLGLGQKVPLGLIRKLKPEMAGLLEIHKVRQPTEQGLSCVVWYQTGHL